VSRPLEGIRVIEVSMWGFVPSAGAVLADMGAEVIKIESPSGDPMRGLSIGGVAPDAYGFCYIWEIFNRGKRGMSIDLKLDGALGILDRLLETADVFLTSLLPEARRKMKIDIDDIRRRHPNVIYAVGSGAGTHGPDAEKGGFDLISYWGRSGIASAMSAVNAEYPVPMPGPAFGDCAAGAFLAGGIAAAIAQRAMTGEVSVVDTSLLNWGMWALQPGIVGAKLAGVEEMPKSERNMLPNPLVNSYRTSDSRFVSLSMLQGQRYWPEFCRAVGRSDLIDDPRFATDELRKANLADCITCLEDIFASRPLADWRIELTKQEGQWDVVQKAGELPLDAQALANRYVQDVDYGGDRKLTMVSTPVQFNRQALEARPAPEFGADNDAILTELGLSDEEIIELKIAGVIF
jgi:crotonobetainyl-CoA:carnitine CoA-transferase CaiB-like acyl-CoA transferase